LNIGPGKRVGIVGIGGLEISTSAVIPCAAQKSTGVQVNDAFERLKRNDVRYRFVLDLSPLAA